MFVWHLGEVGQLIAAAVWQTCMWRWVVVGCMLGQQCCRLPVAGVD